MEQKIYAFGMDGFIVTMMKRFAAEGALPHFERMLREGAVNQTLPSFPVWTPTNWATLSTGAHHGGFLPTQSEVSSSFGSWLMAGPGVKRGYERPVDRLGYIHAADVVPTFCRILGAEPPRQAQGAVARDLFEGHEMVRERMSDPSVPS